jgi:hypothetical protein
MKQLLIALGLLLLTATAPAPAAEIHGVMLTERIQLAANQAELVLNGAGIRVFGFMKIYLAALYLPAKMDNSETILRADQPSRLMLRMLRDISAEQLKSSVRKALHSTLTPEQRAPLQPRLDQLYAMFDSLKELPRDSQIVIDYLPQIGTVVRVNGEEKGRFPGADFNHALLRIWIGERPRDPQLREAMLGIR